jgi:hypothetical protein
VDGLDILRHVHARAAVFLGHGQAEQAHLAHFVQQLVGDAILGDHLGFGRHQPFADVALQLIEELFEDIGIHAGVHHAHRASPQTGS